MSQALNTAGVPKVKGNGWQSFLSGHLGPPDSCWVLKSMKPQTPPPLYLRVFKGNQEGLVRPRVWAVPLSLARTSRGAAQ